MGFLKKSSAPSELPNLAIDGIRDHAVKKEAEPVVSQPLPVLEPVPTQPVQTAPAPAVPASDSVPAVVQNSAPVKKEVAGEDYLTPRDDSSKPLHEDIKKVIDENVLGNSKFRKESFFDEVLEDINGGIADVGKLEDWYEKKFAGEDVVSNMKGYWEGNKADIIIESFGAEYKRQINDKVRALRELEEDWREIYFRLVKKEEEMKKEERELKETLGEFVGLCKRRKHEEKEKK